MGLAILSLYCIVSSWCCQIYTEEVQTPTRACQTQRYPEKDAIFASSLRPFALSAMRPSANALWGKARCNNHRECETEIRTCCTRNSNFGVPSPRPRSRSHIKFYLFASNILHQHTRT
ncbi:uncharacterized protein EV422DRAFT_125955 [Fimicolochytrium jonesii]|uniref:uncharacterized protein n=1 Tax=Fimicolochytrium jonesii TaxID=1396493 RepID=UPI0022FF1DD0|nr:uncharacterized protein EV422DRAFT_125955 [Fimicolochytrium jonesii]KAI8818941.1 hypothetical protein EV422DRAFT_125955 [Fimicolochytrium jonesii]